MGANPTKIIKIEITGLNFSNISKRKLRLRLSQLSPIKNVKNIYFDQKKLRCSELNLMEMGQSEDNRSLKIFSVRFYPTARKI